MTEIVPTDWDLDSVVCTGGDSDPIANGVTIHLDERYYPGGRFEIVTRANSPRNKYIQSATLDGKRLDRAWIYQSDVLKGGKLTLVMGPKPNRDWGSSPEAAPPSFDW